MDGRAVGVFGGGTWEDDVFADDRGREEESEDLSVTGVGGGTLIEGLADNWGTGGFVEAEEGRGFKKGTGVATGVFLGMAALLPHSFGSSLLSTFFPFLLPLFFSLPRFCSFQASPSPLCPPSLLHPLTPSSLSLPLRLLFLWARSSLHSMWYRSSVVTVTRSSCCSRASRVGRSLLREASVSALSLQLLPPTTTPGPRPNPSPKPSPRPIPGASVRLQGLEDAGRHEASEPASTLSGVGGESGLSRGGKHRDLQSLVEDERDGGSSIPSKRTLWRN